MLVALTEKEASVLLSVRVKPRARANRIEGERNGILLVSVSAAPADGAANAAAIGVLADALEVAKSTLIIARGHKLRDKTIRIEQLSAAEVEARLINVLHNL